MGRRIAAPPCALSIPADAQAIERGCGDCHGSDGAGRACIDDGNLHVKGANISPGPGNAVSKDTAADCERTLRHGVKPDGRPALIMPSKDHNHLTDADLCARFACVRQLPPAAGGAAEFVLPLPLHVLYGLGPVPDAATIIDHQRALTQPQPKRRACSMASTGRRCASAAMAKACRAARFLAARRRSRWRRT